MKIAFIVEKCHKRGGHERYYAEMAERLSLRHEVHVFANSLYDAEKSRIVFHKIPMIKRPAFLMIVSFILFTLLKLSKHSFDIVQSNGPNSLIQNVVRVASCQAAWVKVKAAAVSSDKVDFVRKVLDDLFSYLTLGIEKWIYKRDNGKQVIAISEAIKSQIIQYYKKPSENITVIYNGVNLEEFSPSNGARFRAKIRKRYGLSQRDIVLLFVGADFERKGLRYVIKALSLLRKQIKLMVVGVMENWQAPYLKHLQLAKDLLVEDRILFINHTRDVNQYFGACDIFVFPTLYEPFGQVITEAMASGVPVITSRLSGAAELIENGTQGFLLKDSTDSEEIAKSIKFLCENETIRKNMGINARKTMEKIGSWERVVEQTETFYESIRYDGSHNSKED